MGDFDDVAASVSNELAYRSLRVTRQVVKYPLSPEHASQRSIWHFCVLKVCNNRQASITPMCGVVDASWKQEADQHDKMPYLLQLRSAIGYKDDRQGCGRATKMVCYYCVGGTAERWQLAAYVRTTRCRLPENVKKAVSTSCDGVVRR